MIVNPMIHDSWKQALSDEFSAPYFTSLKQFLIDEKMHHKVFPIGKNIFNAYDSTPFDDVKVVILGQDPYHGDNQAHGLAFSVQEGLTHPPSLRNIFQELNDDIGCTIPLNGTLTKWANAGVLLLNTVLTVRASEAHSHKNRGWERLTDATIRILSDKGDHIVFILWGRSAQAKSNLIDESKHLILRAPHPSPLSSYRGFFGSKPFSKSNTYLQSVGKDPIDWCL